ncbi:MAG TPA: UPF0182 family protein [Gemmatimonadaceae bacterium]|nr:UPF0182 family protein [Gemmatimonadaceae bacterium]
MTHRRWFFTALAAAALVLLAGRVLAGWYTEFLWYQAMGASSLWRSKTMNTWLLRALSAVAGSVFVFMNVLAVRNSVVSLSLPRRIANLEIPEEVPGRYLTGAAAFLSVLLGAVLTIPQESTSWTLLGLVRYGVPFRDTDPYFHQDLGFFTYWLPFENALFYWSLLALVIAALVVIFLYAITSSLRWERGELRVSGYVRRHLAVLAALLLVLLGWSYRLDQYTLLTNGTGPEGAFGYVDHHVLLHVNVVLMLFSWGAAVLVGWAAWTGQLRLAAGTIGGLVLLSLMLHQALPAVVRRGGPEPDTDARELDYLATRAAYTQRAYAVNRLTRAAPRSGFATLAELSRAVPAWHAGALARAALHGGRAGAPSGQVGWRATSAGIVAELVERPAGTAATPPPESAPRAGGGWTLLRVDASRADERGALVGVEDGGSARGDAIPLPQPLVHDSASGYSIVSDSLRAVPAAEIVSLRSRLAHAWSLQNLRLLFGPPPSADARIVMHRDVRDRVRTLAPFFLQGRSLTPILYHDSLHWALHLYSYSRTYPLSQHFTLRRDELSLLHHAATAVVQASTGRVTMVLSDTALDPLSATWVGRFPEMFKSPDEVPPELAALLPPPTDGALAQTAAFARFGTRTQGGSNRHVPTEALTDAGSPEGETLIRIPGAVPQVATTTPLLGAGDSVTAIVLTTGGARPRSWWYELPKSPGRWPTIADQLRRRADSTAGGAPPRDSGAPRGRLLAVPLDSGAAFVQPFYTLHADGTPLLARVAVLVDGTPRVVRDLAELAGGERQPVDSTPPATPAAFRERVEALYDQMRAALQRGDWTGFGRAYDELGRLLGRAPRAARQ